MVSVEHGQLFCGVCNDFVYDTDFDRAVAVLPRTLPPPSKSRIL